MIFRIRRVITGLLFCHLILASGMFTSELLLHSETSAGEKPHPPLEITLIAHPAPSTNPPAEHGLDGNNIPDLDHHNNNDGPGTQSSARASLFADSLERDEDVKISAVTQEKSGGVFKLKGNVEIEFRDLLIRGEELIYDSDSSILTSPSHFSIYDGARDEHIEASHGEYNVRTQNGKFYDVIGTAGVRFRGKNVTLSSDDPFSFTGKVVEKVGRNRYLITDGSVTSCSLPQPKWTFNARRIVVNMVGSASIYNTTFRLKKIPIFYFPFVAHPVSKFGRETGFLLPTFGASSRKGTIIGDSFYWAINRSYDATLGAEYFSSRGWAQHGNFRARPTQKSSLDATYFGVLDRGFGPQKIDQGGEDAKLNAEALFPHDVRGVASIEYLSSFVFRQAFTETFTQAVNSEVKSLAFLSKSYHGFFLNTLAGRYQNFQSTNKGDVISILQLPSIQLSSVDQKLASTPFYWAFSGAAEGVSRREPNFQTNALVGRFEVTPDVSLPIFFRGWTFRPEMILHNTYYTQRKSAIVTANVPLDEELNRRALEFVLEMRPPTLGRIFDRSVFSRTVKHTMEPFVTYRIVNGISGFQNIIRFDQRDILSNTHELEYGITHRLFLKKPKSQSQADCDLHPETPCDNSVHEFISWDLAQKYFFDPTFGSALISGKRDVFTTSAQFTGFAFLTDPHHFSPLVSRLRLRASSDLDVSWQLDYDVNETRINASTVFVNYRLGDFFAGASHTFFHSAGEIFVSNLIPAPDQFNQFRILGGFGGPSKRGLSTAASIGFDADQRFLQYGSLQTSYNWDCCGVSMEYRRFALGTVRNENQFRFALTLANIGAFGNLKRQDKLF